MGLRGWSTSILLILPLAAACTESAAPETAEDTFRASYTGAAAGEYEGIGRFTLMPRGRGPDRPIGFILHSIGTGDSRGQALQLLRGAGGLPEAGSYELGDGSGGPGDFVAFFSVRAANRMARYRSTGGTLAIASASRELVEGSFTFNGVRVAWCEANDDRSHVRCEFVRGGEGQPTINVTGSFRARGGPPPRELLGG
jgi:hypothetical protein